MCVTQEVEIQHLDCTHLFPQWTPRALDVVTLRPHQTANGKDKLLKFSTGAQTPWHNPQPLV